jgi:hypothetical protein
VSNCSAVLPLRIRVSEAKVFNLAVLWLNWNFVSRIQLVPRMRLNCV